jgi:hypothetical protein
MNLNTEPAVIAGIIGGIITAAIPVLARSLGWTETMADEWETLFQSLVPLIGVLLTALSIRQLVYSPASYDAKGENAPE